MIVKILKKYLLQIEQKIMFFYFLKFHEICGNLWLHIFRSSPFNIKINYNASIFNAHKDMQRLELQIWCFPRYFCKFVLVMKKKALKCVNLANEAQHPFEIGQHFIVGRFVLWRFAKYQLESFPTSYISF